MFQTTIRSPIHMSGPGLHTGRACRVVLRPAGADFGRRLSLAGQGGFTPVDASAWVPSRMSTSLQLRCGTIVRTVEHLLAALNALAIDNVAIEIHGTEVPILDGSALPWWRALQADGLRTLGARRRILKICRPVQIAVYGGFLRAEPAEAGLFVDVTYGVLYKFPVMRWSGLVSPETFGAELAPSRSFGDLRTMLGLGRRHPARPKHPPPIRPNQLTRDIAIDHKPWEGIERLEAERDRRAPLLRGWRPSRTTLIVGSRILPLPRFADEPVRHVALDLVGDLALAGGTLEGRIVADNPSHIKNFALVAALMRDPRNYEWVER